MIDPEIAEVLERFPFLTLGTMLNKPYLGIVQSSTNAFISMYLLDEIPTEELRRQFLEAGDEWWWGSNRQIPINIFLKGDFGTLFAPVLKQFSTKEFVVESGPVVNLNALFARRVRRRQITLVRKMP